VACADDGEGLVIDQKHRYEVIQSLGEGGVGEVALVEDHDIRRHVAMKRLKAGEIDTGLMLRFVDEIRTIGVL
jgi:serine/threonine-protein kinase